MIYDGISVHDNGESSTDRRTGKSDFNSSYNDNAYVGFMYGTVGASTYAETHANTNDSTIKTVLDTWYISNIKNTTNEQYVVDAIYCIVNSKYKNTISFEITSSKLFLITYS